MGLARPITPRHMGPKSLLGHRYIAINLLFLITTMPGASRRASGGWGTGVTSPGTRPRAHPTRRGAHRPPRSPWADPQPGSRLPSPPRSSRRGRGCWARPRCCRNAGSGARGGGFLRCCRWCTCPHDTTPPPRCQGVRWKFG